MADSTTQTSQVCIFLSAVAHFILVCDQARVLGVCAAYLSLPFMRGKAQLHRRSHNQEWGWGGGGLGKRGQILLAQNFATTPQTQKSIIILLSFLHGVIFSTPSDKYALNVLPLLSSWETLFLNFSPIPPRKQLQQQPALDSLLFTRGKFQLRWWDHFTRCKKRLLSFWR